MSAMLPRQPMRRSVVLASCIAAALLAIGIAGWAGYREQMTAWAPGGSAARLADAEARTALRRPARQDAAASAGELTPPDRAASDASLAWPLWEFQLKQPVPPRDPPLTPLPWRLIGATQVGGAWQIVVVRQGKAAPEFFKKGDSLPGGYRIDSITEEDVTLAKGGRPVILSYIGSR
jgi:hypothetical protein